MILLLEPHSSTVSSASCRIVNSAGQYTDRSTFWCNTYLLDEHTIWVPNIHWAHSCFLIHQFEQPIHQIINKTERACLTAVTIYCYILTVDCLHNEITGHTSIVWMHSRAVCVENTSNTDVYIVLTMVIKEQSFGSALALVVTRPHPNWIYVPPVGLWLGSDIRITIDLAGA